MNLLNKALLRMSGWSRTTWCLAILMTVAFVLIGRLAQLQVFDTFDLEKKNLLQVQVARHNLRPQWQAIGDECSYKIFICGP